MTYKLILGAGLVAAALSFGTGAFAQDKVSQKFLKDAIDGNYAEVQMGQLAQKNGASDGVRDFGKILEKDHTDANKKAIDAANAMGVTPPTGPNSRQKASYDRMSKMSGAKFDAAFVKDMIADHKKDIREYDREAKKTDAAGSYAKETLPTLHKHLDTAQSLSGAATTGAR